MQNQTEKNTQKNAENSTTRSAETNTEPPTTKTVVNNNTQTKASLSVDDVSEQVLTQAKSVINSITNNSMSELEKVTAIHAYLVKTVNYDTTQSKADIHTAKGALINKLAVCDGYAEGFAVLCYTAGVQAEMVYGIAKNSSGRTENHAWNIVKIDGVWFNVDVTWDDPIVNNTVVTDGSNISYNYFLITDAKISKTHTASSYSNKYSCNSDKYSDYVTNLIWKSVADSEYPYVVVTSMADVKAQMQNYINSGKKTFQIIYNSPGATDAQLNTLWEGLGDVFNQVINEMKLSGSFKMSGSMSSDGYIVAKFSI